MRLLALNRSCPSALHRSRGRLTRRRVGRLSRGRCRERSVLRWQSPDGEDRAARRARLRARTQRPLRACVALRARRDAEHRCLARDERVSVRRVPRLQSRRVACPPRSPHSPRRAQLGGRFCSRSRFSSIRRRSSSAAAAAIASSSGTSGFSVAWRAGIQILSSTAIEVNDALGQRTDVDDSSEASTIYPASIAQRRARVPPTPVLVPRPTPA